MSIPVGYLIGLAVLAFPVLRLPRVPMSVGTPAFFVSMSINELPVLATLAFGASTALAVSEGDLASPVAIGAAVLAAACLGLQVWRGVAALSVLRRAMGPIDVSGRLPLWRVLAFPFAVRPRAVERFANLSYGPFGRRNSMDLYRRRGATTGARAPVLVHFHGGYYTTGHKSSQSLPMLHRLAERGWVCLSANYRLRPAATFEDHLVDVKRLVAWVRAHADEWGVDPERIVLSGSSAGAHMSAMAAFTDGDPAYQPGFEDADTSVSAVVSLGGYLGRYFDGRPETSPTENVPAGAPPVLVVHGTHDSLVPVADARRFAERLRADSRNLVVYAELPGAHHGFDLYWSPRFAAVVNAVEAFTAEVFARQRVR
ncbi:alpha/beta hydrolase [Promicromonospora sp. NPDC059942]|uniref:alpha/beta hydrolase n=1 Tax=Promicromonospora sp. NPDC059942 TaxID=3347009 RepID=UPI0036532AD9